MKKEVLVFILDEFADWEPAYICAMMNNKNSDYVVKTISLNKELKRSTGGLRVFPDYSVDDFPKAFSLLILVGGYTWMNQKNDALLPLVAYAVEKHIPVAAICNGVNFLAEHGYLDSIRHTGNGIDYIKSTAPQYKGEQYFLEKQAVCDSNIVTANGTGTLEFAREIMLLLNLWPESDVQEWYKEEKAGVYPD